MPPLVYGDGIYRTDLRFRDFKANLDSKLIAGAGFSMRVNAYEAADDGIVGGVSAYYLDTQSSPPDLESFPWLLSADWDEPTTAESN